MGIVNPFGGKIHKQELPLAHRGRMVIAISLRATHGKSYKPAVLHACGPNKFLQ